MKNFPRCLAPPKMAPCPSLCSPWVFVSLAPCTAHAIHSYFIPVMYAADRARRHSPETFSQGCRNWLPSFLCEKPSFNNQQRRKHHGDEKQKTTPSQNPNWSHSSGYLGADPGKRSLVPHGHIHPVIQNEIGLMEARLFVQPRALRHAHDSQI